MPESWEHTRRYDSSFAAVVLAFFLRYPSPVTPHIVSVDVVSRQVSLHSGCIYTDRIILKRGAASALPKWFPKAFLGKSEAWIFERSNVDVEGNEAVVLTRNLDHRHLMDLQEDLFIKSHNISQGHDVTDFNTSAMALSSVGFSLLQSRVESFSINRYKLAVERSRNQVHTLVDLLRNPSHRASLLDGHPPPLSAMLAPALGETFTRWEELGSGFSGHGFDDREKERFLPDPDAMELAPVNQTTYLNWARARRAQAVQNASERLSGIRARLFAWRLQMKEVEKEEVIHPVTKKPIDNSSAGSLSSANAVSASNANSTSNENATTEALAQEAERPQIRKSKSWVWEWSRNR